MNTQELRNKIHELEAELKSFKSELDKELNKPKMFPQEGDKYWISTSLGDVICFTEYDNLDRVGIYRTKEEAEKARDIAFAKQRVKFAIECENDGWTPNWKNSKEYKFYYYKHFDPSEICINYFYTVKEHPNYMYIKSEEIAEKILAEHREDLELIFSE